MRILLASRHTPWDLAQYMHSCTCGKQFLVCKLVQKIPLRRQAWSTHTLSFCPSFEEAVRFLPLSLPAPLFLYLSLSHSLFPPHSLYLNKLHTRALSVWYILPPTVAWTHLQQMSFLRRVLACYGTHQCPSHTVNHNNILYNNGACDTRQALLSVPPA